MLFYYAMPENYTYLKLFILFVCLSYYICAITDSLLLFNSIMSYELG